MPRKPLPEPSPNITTPRLILTASDQPRSTTHKRPRPRPSSRARTSLVASPSTSTSPIKPKAKRARTSRGHEHADGTVEPPALQADEETEEDGIEVKYGEASGAPAASAGLDPEAELEAWQDFAADHYEMVEQLPLELHRNFRLLRELDDGSLAQADKLHVLIRKYIMERLAAESRETPVRPNETPLSSTPNASRPGEETATSNIADVEMAGETDLTSTTADADSNEVVPGDIRLPEQAESLIPDGEGGLLLPPLEPEVAGEDQKEVPARLQFPPSTGVAVESETHVEPADPPVVIGLNTTGETSTPPQKPSSNEKTTIPADIVKRFDPPFRLLPEIARLSREIVRTGEEKLAVAMGAYNSIDRHIRALDSALTTQEASILLGLRTATLPSSAVDESLNLVGDTGGLPTAAHGNGNVVNGVGEGGEGEDGEGFTVGVGGGSGGGRKRDRGKRRRGRGRGRGEDENQLGSGAGQVVDGGVVLGGLVEEDWDVIADPSEPRYCYCNKVSYGEMIGCENDECPLEWFHLGCTGLQASPAGKWWCNICRPKVGLGKAGVGPADGVAMGGGGGRGGDAVTPSQSKSKSKARPRTSGGGGGGGGSARRRR